MNIIKQIGFIVLIGIGVFMTMIFIGLCQLEHESEELAF